MITTMAIETKIGRLKPMKKVLSSELQKQLTYWIILDQETTQGVSHCGDYVEQDILWDGVIIDDNPEGFQRFDSLEDAQVVAQRIANLYNDDEMILEIFKVDEFVYYEQVQRTEYELSFDESEPIKRKQ